VTRNGLVCLVGRIGSPTRRTKETRQTEQTGLLIPFASSRLLGDISLYATNLADATGVQSSTPTPITMRTI